MSGVKGCKIKINLEMPNDVFSDSPPARPHARYYIYGEPHTYTCWPLSLQKYRMMPLPAPCLGGEEAGGGEGTMLHFSAHHANFFGYGEFGCCLPCISLGVFTLFIYEEIK